MFIKLENLKVDMEIKNYKELCRILDEPVKTGDSKNSQLKWFAEHFRYEKKGHKFIIKEILNQEIQPLPKRGGANNTVEYPNCKINRNDWDSVGVYKITLDNQIYVGSTTKGFRNRFLGHTYEYNNSLAKHLLDDGGLFEIIEVCNEMNEPQIRELENKYIQYYRNLPNWNLINKKDAWSYTEPKYKTKYKTIRVDSTKYSRAIELLSSNNIKFKLMHSNKKEGDVSSR